MKKGLTLTLFLALQIITYSVQGQSLSLESIDEVIITPEDVNVHYEEQIEYYSKKYQTLIDDLTDKKAAYELELEQIESKKRVKRKDAKYAKELSLLIVILDEDIKVLRDCIGLWQNVQMPDSEDFGHLFSSRCYNIITEGNKYSPEKYTMLTTYKDEQISWYELAEGIEREEEETIATEPETTKWVRKKADRNCLSADPNDCMVWCLMVVPGATQTITKIIEECPLGFDYETNDTCIRAVSIDNKNKTAERLRIVSTTTLKEIHPVSFEESDCQ